MQIASARLVLQLKRDKLASCGFFWFLQKAVRLGRLPTALDFGCREPFLTNLLPRMFHQKPLGFSRLIILTNSYRIPFLGKFPGHAVLWHMECRQNP